MLALQGAAFAQTAMKSSWYLGGSVGKATIKPDTGALPAGATEDRSSTGYKVLVGYQFNPNLAIEGAFQNLGKYTFSAAGSSAVLKNQGVSVAAVGFLPVATDFSLIGKAGIVMSRFKGSASAPGFSLTDSETKSSLMLGFGAEYNLTSAVAIRGEYEYFGKPEIILGGKTKTDLLSVGVLYRF